jgi:hypothetical protein
VFRSWCIARRPDAAPELTATRPSGFDCDIVGDELVTELSRSAQDSTRPLKVSTYESMDADVVCTGGRRAVPYLSKGVQ